MGGPTKANVFTKIQLALFGEYDWNGVPAMPVEIMLLPPPFFLLQHLRDLVLVADGPDPPARSSWTASRSSLPARPGSTSCGRARERSLRSRRPEPFSRRGARVWKNFFIGVDDGSSRSWERFAPRPCASGRSRAAHAGWRSGWRCPGGLGGIYPAMANSDPGAAAPRLSRRPPADRGAAQGDRGARRRGAATRFHFQPCLVAGVGHRARGQRADRESDLPRRSPGAASAPPTGCWTAVLDAGRLAGQAPARPARRLGVPVRQPLLSRPRRHRRGRSWRSSRSHDPDADRRRLAKERGLGWFLGMQGQDGGWASFDADNNRLLFNNIPFADHGALLDPSTEDLTGARPRAASARSGYRRDDPADPAGRSTFLRRTQRHDGPWYGRWGVNYIYGTWSVLRGLEAIGAIRADESMVQRAVRWLERRQNADGGWGETCETYADAELAGRGRLDAEPDRVGAARPVRRGPRQRPRRSSAASSTSCEASAPTAAGTTRSGTARAFPRVFYLQVPPLRPLLPALGAGSVSPAHAVEHGGSQPRPVTAAARFPRSRLPQASRAPRPRSLSALGRFGGFLGQALGGPSSPPFKLRPPLDRIHFIGFRSLPIILLTGAFTGMVLGLQIFLTLSRFGSEAFLGPRWRSRSSASWARCSPR